MLMLCSSTFYFLIGTTIIWIVVGIVGVIMLLISVVILSIAIFKLLDIYKRGMWSKVIYMSIKSCLFIAKGNVPNFKKKEETDLVM